MHHLCAARGKDPCPRDGAFASKTADSCTQGLQPLAEALPEALHELWFRWHAAAESDAAAAGASPDAAAASPLPGTAARSSLLAGLTGSSIPAVDVSAWPARVLQLRLAARHAARCFNKIIKKNPGACVSVLILTVADVCRACNRTLLHSMSPGTGPPFPNTLLMTQCCSTAGLGSERESALKPVARKRLPVLEAEVHSGESVTLYLVPLARLQSLPKVDLKFGAPA